MEKNPWNEWIYSTTESLISFSCYLQSPSLLRVFISFQCSLFTSTHRELILIFTVWFFINNRELKITKVYCKMFEFFVSFIFTVFYFLVHNVNLCAYLQVIFNHWERTKNNESVLQNVWFPVYIHFHCFLFPSTQHELICIFLSLRENEKLRKFITKCLISCLHFFSLLTSTQHELMCIFTGCFFYH